MKNRIFVVALFTAQLSFANAPDIIGVGWGFSNISIDELAANADLFADTGLDGIAIGIQNVEKDVDGQKVRINTSCILRAPEWEKKIFGEEIKKLKAITQKPGLQKSYFKICWLPEKRDKMDWRNDEAWELAARNMGVAAWIAKQGGLKGFCIDPEYDFDMFWLQPGDADFETTAALARKRGRRIMEEIAKEFPDVTLFSFWWHSRMGHFLNAPDPMAAVKANGALWPAFVDGILDALPPRAIMVDGDEYCYNARAKDLAFYESAHRSTYTAAKIVAPENRTKFLAQIRAGSGHYLDKYVNTNGSFYFCAPLNGSRLTHLATNLRQAINAAPGGVIWLYGEKRPFVLMKNLENKWLSQMTNTWYDLIPGMGKLLHGLRSSEDDMQKRLEELRTAGALTNLVMNGECKAREELQAGQRHPRVLPKPYWANIPNSPTATMGTDTSFGHGDKSSIYMQGKFRGYWFVPITDLVPGQCYYVELFICGPKQQLHHDPVRCGWADDVQTALEADGRTPIFGAMGTHRRDCGMPPLEIGKTDENGWTHRYQFVRVPWTYGRLTLRLGLKAYHQNDKEITWFDDIRVYRLF